MAFFNGLLDYLTMAGCSELTDLSPLRSMDSLTHLTLSPEAKDFAFLRSFPKLERLSYREDPNNHFLPDQTVAEFWQDVEDLPSLSFLRNAGYKPIKVGGGWELNLSGSRVKDLSFVRGTPITLLHLGDSELSDLTPLKGMPIKELWLYRSKVVDLSPLIGMPLEHLNVHSTNVRDISALRGLPLTNLRLNSCDQLEDVSALREIKTLKELTLPLAATDFEFLRTLPNLERLSFWESSNGAVDKSAVDFWKRHDQLKLNALNASVIKRSLPKDILTAEEAKNRLGEKIIVKIKVASSTLTRTSKWYYLNSCDDFKDPDNFCVAIVDASPDRIQQLGLPSQADEMQGRTVVAQGKCGLSFGSPRVVVDASDCIWIVED